MEANFEYGKMDFENIFSKEISFFKADNFQLSKEARELKGEPLNAISSSMAPALQWLSYHTSYKGTMFVQLKPGTHLGMVKGSPNTFWGNLLNGENKVSGLAQLSYANPKGADIASVVFAVLSYFTGQYNMNQTALNLSNLNGMLRSLNDHIESKDYSDLTEIFEFLKTVIEDGSNIVQSPERLEAYRSSVIETVKKALGTYDYNMRELQKLKGRLCQDDDDIVLSELINQMLSSSYKLHFSAVNYGLANIVELNLFGIANPEELEVRRNRVVGKYNEAVSAIKDTYSLLDEYMDGKSCGKRIKKENKNIPGKIAVHGIVPFPFNFLVDKLASDNKSAKIEKKLRKEIDGSLKRLESISCKVSPIPVIDDYISISNKSPILVIKDDRYYVDFIDKGQVGVSEIIMTDSGSDEIKAS